MPRKINIVAQQCISHFQRCFPSWNVEGSLYLGGGYLAEVIVPHVVVGVEMLLVIVRLPQACLEMCTDCQGTVSVLSERVHAECEIALDAEVVKFMTCECIVSECVPFQILFVLSLRPGI